MNLWGGKRYHSLNYFLRQKFGQKVFKISLDGGFSCPNRDGKVGYGGCIFCSERGSGDYAGNRDISIHNQFEDIKEMMKSKWKKGKYIAYFQAYTNTYAPIEILRKRYYEALKEKDVVSIAIATRPDCLDDEVLDLLEEINKKYYLWIELGLQTSNDNIARKINRGYDLNTFEKAIENLKKRNIDFVVHTIFGLPEETKEDMLKTVDYVAHTGAKGIKFHLLHLMKDTPLVDLYEKGELEFMSKDEYINLICESIQRIPLDMVIHRLTGDAPRNLLIEPTWSLKKWEILNAIDNCMKDNGYYQGRKFINSR